MDELGNTTYKQILTLGLYLDDRGKKEDEEERTSHSSANETTRMQVWE